MPDQMTDGKAMGGRIEGGNDALPVWLDNSYVLSKSELEKMGGYGSINQFRNALRAMELPDAQPTD
jgi:hypothetical protein